MCSVRNQGRDYFWRIETGREHEGGFWFEQNYCIMLQNKGLFLSVGVVQTPQNFSTHVHY